MSRKVKPPRRNELTDSEFSKKYEDLGVVLTKLLSDYIRTEGLANQLAAEEAKRNCKLGLWAKLKNWWITRREKDRRIMESK